MEFPEVQTYLKATGNFGDKQLWTYFIFFFFDTGFGLLRMSEVKDTFHSRRTLTYVLESYCTLKTGLNIRNLPLHVIESSF